MERFEKSKDGCLTSEEVADNKEAHKLNELFPGSPVGDDLTFTGKVCVCKGDNCNGASNLGISAILVGLIALMINVIIN